MTIENAQPYVDLLLKNGEEALYKYAIALGIRRRAMNVSMADIEMLDMSDAFFTLFRRTGEEKFFILGKVFRKAAHVLYRQFFKMDEKKPPNARFLRLVK